MSESGFKNLVQELRRRRVFRVATLYVVSFWPIIQIADILSPTLNLSDDTMTSLLLYFIMGFPLAISIAWLYNLTPKGLVRNDGTEEPSKERMFGNRLEVAVILFCVSIAAVLYAFQKEILEIISQPEPLPEVTQLQNYDPLTQNYQSIAVLPFVPFSDNRQDEFFADGLAEELLNVLAKIQSLRVAARTSSFAYKGVNRNIQKIGRDLGVDVILEGSVRRNDVNNTIRVTAQLIDVRTGTHLWSETYDRQFNDIFKIQDEITESVIGELKVTLLGEEKEKLLAHETANPEAIIAHTQGRTELAKRTGTAITEAKEHFERAVELDPNYATAYASLAEANVLMISYAGEDKDNQLKLAQAAADKALTLDKDLGLAWAAQGLIYSSAGEYDDAKDSLTKAIKLNPSYALSYMWFGSLQEDVNDQIRLYEKAFQLDPNSAVAGYNLANNLIDLGRDAEAMDVFSKVIDSDPFYPNAYFIVGKLSLANGRLDQAVVNFKKSYDLGESMNSPFALAHIFSDLGEIENARYWISLLEETGMSPKQRTLDWLKIRLFAEENDWDKAREKLTVIASASDKDNINAFMDSALANYFLEDYPATVKAFETAKEKTDGNPLKLLKMDWLSELVYIAHAYMEIERREEAREIIANVRRLAQENADKGFRVWPHTRFMLGMLELVDGNTDLGLVTIQRAVNQGWSNRWQLDNEPILRDLKVNPEFIEIRQSLTTRVRIIKEQLAYEDKFSAL